MLSFTYQNAWAATYQGDARDEAWLKRLFTYTDMTDVRHKARLGWFPTYCTLDTSGHRMSHGQVIHAVRQAKADRIQFQISDPSQRYLVNTGPIDPGYLPGITAYDYQALSAQIALGHGHGLVTVATGGGKTVILGMCLKALVTLTDCPGVLMLIFSKDLLNQTAARMVAYGVPSEDIGIIHSDISPEKQRLAAEKRVVLSTHLSIMKYDGVIEKTRYVITDEAHKAIGPLWSSLFGKLPNLVNVLGFTATPWDTEEERQKMLAIYGQELVNIPCKFLIDRGILMRPKSYFIKLYYKDRDIKLCNQMDWRQAKTQFILEDRSRNLLPIVALRKFGGRMLVIYDDLDHGEHLQELYEKEGFETRLAEGKTSTKNRASAVEWFEQDCDEGVHGKVLLASRVFDEGIDIKGGCDIFFAIGAGKDPSKTKQRMGRALRKNRTGILRTFDVQDSNHPILSRWSSARRGALEECGIQPETISLEDFAKLT
jgi:superfamily II DNA or RNA helicase